MIKSEQRWIPFERLSWTQKNVNTWAATVRELKSAEWTLEQIQGRTMPALRLHSGNDRWWSHPPIKSFGGANLWNCWACCWPAPPSRNYFANGGVCTTMYQAMNYVLLYPVGRPWLEWIHKNVKNYSKSDIASETLRKRILLYCDFMSRLHRLTRQTRWSQLQLHKVQKHS